MNNNRKLQFALIGGAMLLFVALLFANTTPVPKKKEMAGEQHEHTSVIDIESYISSEKSTLDKNVKGKAAELENKISSATGSAKISLYDSLIVLYDEHVKPAIAAYYTEQKNTISPSANGWAKTGARYYRAVGFVKPEVRSTLYSKAISAYEKAIGLQPENMEIQTALAVSYVEGSSDPMKGITMLREVLVKDPNNINALLSMGMFAIKSNQHEKAIERFSKIIEVDSTYIQAYLYLADSYEKLNNIKAAIENLKKYEQKVDDVAIKADVQSYINKLSRRES